MRNICWNTAVITSIIKNGLTTLVVGDVLGGVADGVAHQGKPALENQIDNHLHLVEALEVRYFRLHLLDTPKQPFEEP